MAHAVATQRFTAIITEMPGDLRGFPADLPRYYRRCPQMPLAGVPPDPYGPVAVGPGTAGLRVASGRSRLLRRDGPRGQRRDERDLAGFARGPGGSGGGGMTKVRRHRLRAVPRSMMRRAGQRLDRLRRGLVSSCRAQPAARRLDRLPRPDELPGPFRRSFWRSPIRGPWLTSVLGLVLLAGLPVVFVTGLLSYAAYNPDLSHSTT